MLSLRKTLNSTPILLRQTFIRRFFKDKGKSNQSGGKWMQKEVGGKNIRPGGVPSVKGQLAAAVFTWFLQLHLHPEHSRVSSEAEIEKRSAVSSTLQPHGLYSPWNSPGQNSGVGSCSLLQGDLPNSGMEPRSPTLQQILYRLSHQGSPGRVGPKPRSFGL